MRLATGWHSHDTRRLLAEQLEGALLGHIAELAEALDRLLARRVLLLAHNATRLRLHQVLLRQTTGRVLGRAVENLGRAARGHHGAALLIIAIHAILASGIIRHRIFIRKILLYSTPNTRLSSLLTYPESLIVTL